MRTNDSTNYKKLNSPTHTYIHVYHKYNRQLETKAKWPTVMGVKWSGFCLQQNGERGKGKFARYIQKNLKDIATNHVEK